MNARMIGVVGAGVMGAGVAQDLAQATYQVVLIDISEEKLERARAEIRKAVRLHGLFKRSATRPDPDATISRIEFTTDYDRLKDVDFVIENVTEKWEIKQNVYGVMDATCPPRAIFAANTSAIPITRIASATRRPTQVIGIHLMNPVPLKAAAEVIRGTHTSDETLAAATELMTSLGKECIVVNDGPGFVSNRVLMLTINEAIFLVQEGVASAKEIDRLFKTCFGHKMGPLETADLIGLDTILFSIEVLYDAFADSKYRPCPLLKKMVDGGLLGMKSGRGFYSYAAAETKR